MQNVKSVKSIKSIAKTMTIALLASLLIADISYAADQQQRYEANAAKAERTITVFEDKIRTLDIENVTLAAELERVINERAVATTENDVLNDEAISDIPEEETVTESVSYSKERLPENIETNSFFCEDFRRLNVQGTPIYRLQQECYTEEVTGLRYYLSDGVRYYCVALGNAYGIDIGDTWIVTLANGESFGIIYADYKHSIEEIDPFDFGDQFDLEGNQLYNYDGEPVMNVLEFVYDNQTAPKAMILAGTMTYFERFGGLYGDGGNIVGIKYLERKWVP